ncbi:MAG: alpha-galactosidase, partial [Sphaerochaetaceae bacterium]|nr:alpha-galactosidase [Sphaerochaetaceae bacterium]
MCIIGGGSRMWAIEFMRDLTMHDDITGTLVLYDRDYDAAKRNVGVADQCFKVNHWEGHVKVVAEKEIGKALDGCNLVIISIEPGRTECRWGDLVLPEQYGILETVGDTTGPGGIMRARRSIPLFTGFAKEIKAHCPDAWVINYTNPMTLCTAALFREWPGIKALGCCHEVFHLENFIADKV